MAKKKRSNNKRGGHDSDDDSASTTSHTTNSTLNFLAEEEQDNPFELHIDALYEKRGATREKALQGLATLMMTSYCCDDCIERVETLTTLFHNGIKRGSAIEATLAAKCLGLLVLQIGAGPDALQLYRASSAILRKASASATSVGVRSASLDTLSMIAFVALDDPDIVIASMTPLRDGFASPAASGVWSAAIRGWALLLSVLPQRLLTPQWVEEHLDLLARCLAADSVEVRTAAGQAIALLYHNSGLAEYDEDGEEEEEDYAGDGCSTSGSSMAPGMEDIVLRMQALATNRGDSLRRSKRDRAHLTGTFRRLCRSVMDGDVPTVKIKLRHGDVLVVDSISGHVQLAAFKQHLADGFQVHLLRNSLLHEVFGFVPTAEAPEKLSALEKRMYRSPASESSKARTQSRSRARAARGGVLYAGDEY